MLHAGWIDQIERFADLIASLDASLWDIHLPVQAQSDLSPEDAERALQALADVAETAPFDVKTTSAPQFCRVIAQREESNGSTSVRPAFARSGHIWAIRSISDGVGLMFVAANGDIRPGPSLPVTAGNIRSTPLVDTYTNNPIFQKLRARDGLTASCSRCGYQVVCGGSRARAFAWHGNLMGPDPLCPNSARLSLPKAP
jgi:radical SAM protein with 4Fe4S-binding SPASM domain